MSNIVVYGSGKTGQSILKLLQKRHENAVLFEDSTESDKTELFAPNRLVITSPGVPPNADGMKTAKQNGCKIVGELEYCFPLCRGRCISVTGTNGKTTVCEMIFHILKKCHVPTRLLGNGGVPFSSQVLDVMQNETVILESSSFQLKDCEHFSPYVSVLTNIAPDHLNYHKTFDNYITAKRNNFLHQTDGFAVFNLDDELSRRESVHCKCTKLTYSVVDSTANCYLSGNTITVHIGETVKQVDGGEVANFYKHNKSNALAAILACVCVGVDIEKCVSAIADFAFLPHRMQRVGIVENIEFVDDSKATNVHATVNALCCFTQKIALILGGSDKGESYDEIFRQIKKNVVAVAAVGQTAEDIAECGKKFGVQVVVLDDLAKAARYCFEKLIPTGGVVLMSNACASFDRFRSYGERGDYFVKAVKEIQREYQKN